MDLIKLIQDNVFYSPEKKKELNKAMQNTAPLLQSGPASLGTPLTPAQRKFREERSTPEAMGVTPARPFIPPVSNTGYGGAGALSPQIIQQGTYSNLEGTRQGDREVNVVQRGQQATLNGRPVIADGYGNWLDAGDTNVPMGERKKVGKYTPGADRSAPSATPVQPSAASPLSTLQPGDDIPADQYPEGVPAPGSTPDPSTWRSSGTDTSTSKREVVKDEDEAMRIWARTHGKLADRVIEKVETRGLPQAGYEAIKSVRQPQNLSDSRESSAVDMVAMGMSPKDAVDFARTGQRETVISPDGTMTTNGEIVKIPDQVGVTPQALPVSDDQPQVDAQQFVESRISKITRYKG